MAYQATGDIDLKSGLQAVSKVAVDPAVGEIVCLALKLNRITEGEPPGGECLKKKYSPAEKNMGVGLYSAVKPIRAWIWIRQNPASAVALGMAAVGLIGLVGYSIGRGKRA